MKDNTVSTAAQTWALYAFMSGFLLFCSSYSIITKYQDITPGYNGRLFEHPYWQTFVTAWGDSLALILYFVKTKLKERRIR